MDSHYDETYKRIVSPLEKFSRRNEHMPEGGGCNGKCASMRKPRIREAEKASSIMSVLGPHRVVL